MPNIYAYIDIATFLADSLSEIKSRNPRFSLRSWAKQIGHKNPSLLSEVLKGKRPVSLTLAKAILKNLPLSPSETRYFQLLVLKSKSKDKEEIAIYENLLKTWRTGQQQDIDIDQYHVIADWYHAAILEMFALKDFKPQASEIAKRLGNSITPASVAQALERLLRLGLVRYTDDGKLVRSHDQHMHTESRTGHEAIRRHHKQMLEKAEQAIEDQALTERHLYGTILSITADNYASAVDIIVRCHQQLRELACSQNADHVYRLNTQFFNLTPQRAQNTPKSEDRPYV